MNELISGIRMKALRRTISWVLAVIMILTCVGPAGFVFANDKNSGSWEVFYSISTEEEDGIQLGNDDGEIILPAREAQEVFLTMQLWADDVEHAKRFKDEFHITLPSDIYDALVDVNGDPNEWFESDIVTDGYLLELKEPVATDSNATSSNKNRDTVDLKFRFVEELRKAEKPEEIEIDDSKFVLGFEVPEDMVLICQPNNYNCEITSVTDVPVSTFDLTSEWDTSWSLVVTKPDGTILDLGTGEAVAIEIGDMVEFKMSVKANTPEKSSKSFGETFELTMPKDIYDMIGEDYETIVLGGAKLFEFTADDANDPVKLTVAFTQDMKDKGSSTGYVIDGGWISFGFESTKEMVIKYTPDEESSSCEVEYTTKEEIKPIPSIGKSVVAIFNKNEATEKERPIAAGDYVLYRVTAKVKNVPEQGYIIDPGTIYDYFNPEIFSFVDIKDAAVIGDIDSSLSGIPESQGLKDIRYVLTQKDRKYKNWDPAGSIPPINGMNPSFSDGEAYKNAEELKIDYLAGEESNSISMYICLKVNPSLPPQTTPGDFRNWVVWEDKYSSKGVDSDKWYDAALTVNSTTKMKKDTTTSEVMRAPSTFPNNVNNPSFKVSDGDIITYAVRIYSQGNTDYKLRELSIYIPEGLTLLEADDERLDNYLYSTSADTTTPPNQSPTSAAHLNGALKPTGEFEFKDMNTGQLYEDFYNVKRYTYTPDNISVVNGKTTTVYFTCEVSGIDQILGKLGKDPTNEDYRLYAQLYGYLLSAEVSEIVDINETDVQGENTPIVEDEDSYLDRLPFNDWFNNKSEIKNSNLWIYDKYVKGEIDHNIDGHVRSLSGQFSAPWSNGDEDDHDYATLYVAVGDEVTQEEVIRKLLETRYSAADIRGALDALEIEYSAADFYKDYNFLDNSNAIQNLNTIIPYTVYINPDGSRFMEGVTLTDTLPDSMEFLLRPDGKPVVQIEEIVEIGARAQVQMDTNGDGVLETVEIIDYNFAEACTVKDIRYDAYQTKATVATEMPDGLVYDVDHDIWNWQYRLIGQASDTLELKFGNINNNAFRVTYFGVVKERSNIYRNTATVNWLKGEKSAHYEFSEWNDKAGMGYVKRVLDQDGHWVQDYDLTSMDAATFPLTYKLTIDADSSQGFAANSLKLYDYISDLGLGSGNISEIKDFIYYDGEVGNGGTVFALGDEIFLAEASADNKILTIHNDKTVPTGSHTYEIVFTVVYDDVPYGANIKNTFGVTTSVTAPLKLELTKVDGNTDSNDAANGLKDAKFALTYANGDIVYTDKTKTKAVVFETNNDGKSAVEFHLDPAKKDTNDNCYYLNLTETDAPNGYFDLGGKDSQPGTTYVIQLKVTEQADGVYKYEAINEEADFWSLTTGDRSEIQIKAKNYSMEDNLFINLDLLKKLIDAETGEELTLIHSYDFEMKLKTGNTAAVTPNKATASNSTPDGKIQFHNIEITEAGEYTFEIKELHPNSANYFPGHTGISYDPGTITATVNVVRDPSTNKLKLEKEIQYSKSLKPDQEHFFDDNASEKDETFLNFKLPDGGLGTDSVILKATKKLTGGRQLADKEFTFKVELEYASNNTHKPFDVLSETNDANGNITFDALSFDKAGTYIFRIYEEERISSTITYDKTIYYAKVEVTENRLGKLKAVLTYGTEYNATNHTMSGKIDSLPLFENLYKEEPQKPEPDKAEIVIQKVSYRNGTTLAGAEFELSYCLIEGSDEWKSDGKTLITAGAEGTVTVVLPDNYADYKYRLIEKKAPSGYSRSNIGTIEFTVTTDGQIKTWSHNGTPGYVEVFEDDKVIVVKNNTSGGGGGGGGGGGETPKPPVTPGTPGTPGGSGGGSTTPINDNDTPLGKLNEFIEDTIIPLTGLVKTGDYGIAVGLLVAVMAAAGIGFVAVVRKRKKS